MGAATASGDYADICSQRMDQPTEKTAGDTFGKVWVGRLRRVGFAADSPADLDTVRITHRFLRRLCGNLLPL